MSGAEDTAGAAAGAAGGPLYRRLAEALKAEIASGQHPVGSLLPTEQELCEAHGASRYTVREALRLLAEDGLVERRQGRGTEVVSSAQRPVYAQSLTSLSQLYDYAAETVLEIDRVLRVVPEPELAGRLGRRPGRQWLLAEGLRKTLGGETICVSRVFLHDDFGALAPELPQHRGAIHSLIESRYGVSVREVLQEISTERLETAPAALLGEAPGAWSILVTRRYRGEDDRPILVSFNWHRLDGFVYSQAIRRE